jgi:heptaprenyl diphosphate synthase
MKANEIARLGILGAAALVLGYVDFLIPLSFTLPGIKLGLANVVLLYALYTGRPAQAWLLMAVKVFLAGFLFAGLSGLLYSLAGGVLSLAAMSLVKRTDSGIIGVSVMGAAFHNIGQIVVACFTVTARAALSFLPYLLVAAAVTGVLVGVSAKALITHTKTLF